MGTGEGNKKQIDFPSGSTTGKKDFGLFLAKALRRHIKKDEIEQRVSTWRVVRLVVVGVYAIMVGFVAKLAKMVLP